jgi:hypothetical protein
VINPTKASGPDLINPRLLKEAAPIIKYPLCKLFNLSGFPIDDCEYVYMHNASYILKLHYKVGIWVSNFSRRFVYYS